MRTRLVVQADDFGMCHAVNEGVVRAFKDGVVTQSVAMVPCPWFGEAVALARRHGIPLGLHATLNSEWEHMRWRPLTDGLSLTIDDGTFHYTVGDARAAVTVEDASRELIAQADRFVKDVGYAPIAVDHHKNVIRRAACATLCEHVGRAFTYPIVEPAREWSSRGALSERDGEVKLEWLLGWIDGLEPGNHFLCTHPGVGGPELSSLADSSSDVFRWTEEYRVADLEVLTSPHVRAAIEAKGIELVSMADLDRVPA